MDQYVGRAVPRKEGADKVTGRARYVDDITMPGMLHGVTVRSSVPRGRITAIHYSNEIPWEQFTVVTAADITNHIGGDNVVALLVDDQPCLAAHAIRPFFLYAEQSAACSAGKAARERLPANRRKHGIKVAGGRILNVEIDHGRAAY